MTSKTIKISVGIIAVIIIVGGLFLIAKKTSQNVLGESSTPVVTSEVSKPKATVKVDRSFEFSAINQKKSEKAIKFTLVNVERKDEVRVKGELRRSPKNYDFLLVRVEIENKEPERLALTPSDYIRLQNEQGKLFAPDYHNGNVILDPISVKKDLISFIVDKNAKKFTFLVGELNKDKEKVEITF